MMQTTLQSCLLASAYANKLIRNYRIMMIMAGRKKECTDHHLYNKLATEAGLSALITKLLYNFML